MPQPLLASVLALAFGLAAMPLAAQTAPAPAEDATATATAEATPTAVPELLPDIALGAEDAPLTVIEYASFTCSHCAAFHEENFPKLKAEYIDTGKVRFIQRDVYFDAPGLWAGILAHCDPKKYYPVSDALMSKQGQWLASQNGDEIAESLRKIGLAAGMSAEQMEACWADQPMVERLVATYQTNATKDGLEGTPTFIIGGEKVPNMAWDQLKAKIDEKLAAAPAPDKPADAAPATDAPAAPKATEG